MGETQALGRTILRRFWILTAVAVVVFAVVVVAVFGVAFAQLRHGEQPPDVAGISRSAPVTAADRAATAEIGARLAGLAPAGAWLVPGPTAVLDQCLSHQVGMMTTAWTPVACTRTVTAYFSFDGDFQQRMRTWDVALRTAGWAARISDDPIDRPLYYYANYAGKPEPGPTSRTYLATDLPASDPYCHEGGTDRTVCLTFRWAERPRPTTDFGGADSPSPGIAVLQKHTVDPGAVESAEFTRNRYVAIVTLTDTYYNPASTPAPTSRAVPTHTACFSGSGDCN